MLERLRSYPSDIAQAAVDYLIMLQSKDEETYHHREVIFLFLESLKYSEDGFLETDEGEFLLTCNWSDIWGGAISGFLDYWFQGKSRELDEGMFGAPDILRDWTQWCFDKGYFELKRYQDFMRSLPLGKSVEMKRLHRASRMLYKLHTPFEVVDNSSNVLSFVKHQEPKVKIEGYVKLMNCVGNQGYFISESGSEIGPVILSQDLMDILIKGDVLNVGLGRFENNWRVLESGNVYTEGVIF